MKKQAPIGLAYFVARNRIIILPLHLNVENSLPRLWWKKNGGGCN